MIKPDAPVARDALAQFRDSLAVGCVGGNALAYQECDRVVDADLRVGGFELCKPAADHHVFD